MTSTISKHAQGLASTSASRRNFLKLTGLATGATVLGACSSGSSKTTIDFLHNETDPPSVDFFKKAIARYEAQHPSVKIDMQLVSTDGRLQRLKSLQSARQMPGVFKIVPEERYTFADQGVIEPLSDIVDQVGKDKYVENSLVEVKGEYYDIPYTINQFSLYMYRKSLLANAGASPARTWDEFADLSKRLTASTGSGGDSRFGTVIPASQDRMTDIYFAQVFWSNGGTYFDQDLAVTLDANDAAERSLELISALAKSSPPGVTSYSYSDMVSTYLTGNVAQDVYAPRLAANLADESQRLLRDTTSAARLGGSSGGAVGYANPNSFAVSTDTYGNDHVEAAKAFLKYLVSPQQIAGFSLTAYPHMVPPLKDVQEDLLNRPLPMNKTHKELAKASFDLSNTMDFTTEAGATASSQGLSVTGKFNRLSPLITSRQISAGMVQDVLVNGTAPAEAVRAAAEKLRSAVKETS